MTLVRYILRGFLRSLLGVFAAIALVIILFTGVENLRRFGEMGADLGAVTRITLLQAPEVLYQVFPLVLMLASLATFLNFARTSELVVMRASGVSALQLIRGAGAGGDRASASSSSPSVNPFVAASIKRGRARGRLHAAPARACSRSPARASGCARPTRRPDGDPGGAHQRRRHHPQPGADAPLRQRRHALRPHRGAGGAADARRLGARERHRVAARRRRPLRARPPPDRPARACRPR